MHKVQVLKTALSDCHFWIFLFFFFVFFFCFDCNCSHHTHNDALDNNSNLSETDKVPMLPASSAAIPASSDNPGTDLSDLPETVTLPKSQKRQQTTAKILNDIHQQ